MYKACTKHVQSMHETCTKHARNMYGMARSIHISHTLTRHDNHDDADEEEHVLLTAPLFDTVSILP